jgi:hypothetical protein
MRKMSLFVVLTLGCVKADYSAGGMLTQCPESPTVCPVGQACEHGYCTPMPTQDGGVGRDIGIQDLGGPTPDVGAVVPRDCQAIKAYLPSVPNGVYAIDPDGPGGAASLDALCEMETAGGGWTRVVNILKGAETWNAWSELVALENSGADLRFNTTGLGIERFSNTADGEDLEFMFVVDTRQRGNLYRGVNKGAWDPQMGTDEFDQGFEYRELAQEEWQVCDQPLQHAQADWNWSMTYADTLGGCNGTRWANGFLLQGSEQGQESAAAIFGLNEFNGVTSWYAITIYARRTP